MILFINACVREESRTKRIADHLLSRMGDTVTEVRLQDIDFPVVDEGFLKKRDELTEMGKFDVDMFSFARQFAAADMIVIAAPFWDMSFPAALKQYLEQICVNGIAFRYTEEGIPIGLCNAKKLYYVTTAGGPIISPEFGYGYVQSLAQNFYGIKETVLIKAENLDIYGADVEAIVNKAMEEIDKLEI